jgi:branched-chain amino acid transport system permease protein
MSYWFTVLTFTGINVLLAYSVYASYMTGQVSIGQAAFFGIGAYVAASLTVLGGYDLTTAVLAGGLAGMIASLFVGIPTLRLKGYYLTIATVAFAEATRVVLHNLRYGRPKPTGAVGDTWQGPDGPVGFRHINYLNEHGISTFDYMIIVWCVVALVLIAFVVIERSRLGRVLRIIEEDQIVAKAIGINVAAMKVGAFAFGGLIAGIGGGLYAHLMTFITGDDFKIHLSVMALAYVVIGGGQTLWGPLLGAVIFTILPEASRPLKDFRLELFGLLMLAVMLFRPTGIISAGNVRKWALGRRLQGGIERLRLPLTRRAAKETVARD